MKNLLKKSWLVIPLVATLALAGCGNDNGNGETEAATTAETVEAITVEEIKAAQEAWGEGLVSISTAFAEGEDYATVAQGVLDDLYGYAYGPVLFKPTIASDVPFRFTEHGAASYFIGSTVEDALEEDGTGFATNEWTAVSFEDDWEFILNGETALGMGTVIITDGEGNTVEVQKSMGWMRGEDGGLRLQLHHSSVPFSAE